MNDIYSMKCETRSLTEDKVKLAISVDCKSSLFVFSSTMLKPGTLHFKH